MAKSSKSDVIRSMQIEAALKQAKALRDAGKIAAAGGICQQILSLDPRQADALHLLGVMALQTDSFEIAIGSLTRAVAARPKSPAILVDFGHALAAAGKANEAVSAYRKALSLRPGNAATYLALGDAQLDLGHASDALKSYRKAQSLEPKNRLAAHMVASLTGEAQEAGADYVATLFDAYAPTFETHLAGKLDYRTPMHLLDLIAPHRPEGGRFASVLDLGCGTGLVGAVFKDAYEAIDGIDIAPAMIEAAQAKGLYRHLAAGDLTALMETDPAFAGPYPLIVAADVFVYIGPLEAVFAAIRDRLALDGLFAFSVERAETGTAEVRSSGRFAHNPDYIVSLAGERGFSVAEHKSVTLRKERSRPIAGEIFLLRANTAWQRHEDSR